MDACAYVRELAGPFPELSGLFPYVYFPPKTETLTLYYTAKGRRASVTKPRGGAAAFQSSLLPSPQTQHPPPSESFLALEKYLGVIDLCRAISQKSMVIMARVITVDRSLGD